jgi:hypothetical protein
MTDVARGIRDRVARIRVLAQRKLAVMTACAWSEGLRVVSQSVVAPRRRKVTALAIIRGLGVRAEQRRCTRRVHAIMTAEASRRRCFIAPVEMTRGAGDVDMRAGKRESGGVVIELRRQRVLRLHRRRERQHDR